MYIETPRSLMNPMVPEIILFSIFTREIKLCIFAPPKSYFSSLRESEQMILLNYLHGDI